VIYCPPELMRLSVDLHEDLVQVQLPVRMRSHPTDTVSSYLSSRHQTKSIPPKPSRFVADLNTNFVQKIFASSKVALPYSYGFLAQTLHQNVQPKTELFRDRYRRRVKARCLPPDENSMDNVCNTSLPIG